MRLTTAALAKYRRITAIVGTGGTARGELAEIKQSAVPDEIGRHPARISCLPQQVPIDTERRRGSGDADLPDHDPDTASERPRNIGTKHYSPYRDGEPVLANVLCRVVAVGPPFHCLFITGRRDDLLPEEQQQRPRFAGPLLDGRYWARNGQEPDRLEPTWGDFSSLLQGLLVDTEGRPVLLSATAFQSLLGQIRDKLAGSEAVRELALALLRELVGR